MSFSEPIKLTVKKKANFTCCWCQERRNKVEIHHIIPQADNGSDIEDNAAPLCGSCHDLYGSNPDLRKEIKLRRDHWYDICEKIFQLSHQWPLGLDVPLLEFVHELSKDVWGIKGIQFTDKKINDDSNPPVLYLSVRYQPPIYRPSRPDRRIKTLSIGADMRFAFHLGIDVPVWNDQEVSNVISFLEGTRSYCELFSQDQQPYMNGFIMFREKGENRLVLSTINSALSTISIRTRFSEKVRVAFLNYLNDVGFANFG